MTHSKTSKPARRHRFLTKLASSLRKKREIMHAYLDSKRLSRSARKGKVLFVDAGSNIGQGFSWFSKFFSPSIYIYELFEPNQNCLPHLQKIAQEHPGTVTVHACGIGQQHGQARFYGVDESEGGALSKGGSTMPSHNSSVYERRTSTFITVDLVDFDEYLRKKSNEFDKIVVKMDIEGAERDLLEYLIDKGSHRLIDTLYVEFHCQHLQEDIRDKECRREQLIMQRMRNDKVRFRLWH